MFYFFYGSDSDKARARARGVVRAMHKKRPNAEYFRITTAEWNPNTFEEFIVGQGLFDRKFIVFADGIFENAEAKQWVLERTTEIGKSENAFVFLEPSLDAASLKKLEKHAQEVKKFEAVEKLKTRSDFNTFALADALGLRDRKKLWVHLSEAFGRGVSPEEINGVLFWQVKSMLLAREAPSATAAGLSPFVFSKSKRYANAFDRDRLVRLSESLIKAFHEAHRGTRDFSIALERIALTL